MKTSISALLSKPIRNGYKISLVEDSPNYFCFTRKITPKTILSLPQGFSLQYVPWGILNGITLSKNDLCLLATDRMTACASLLVVDQNLQHVVHAGLNFNLYATYNDFMKGLQAALRDLPQNLKAEHNINLETSRFYIAEGSEKDSSSVFNFYRVLIESGVPPEVIYLIPSRPYQESENILLCNGVPYRAEGVLKSQIKDLF